MLFLDKHRWLGAFLLIQSCLILLYVIRQWQTGLAQQRYLSHKNLMIRGQNTRSFLSGSVETPGNPEAASSASLIQKKSDNLQISPTPGLTEYVVKLSDETPVYRINNQTNTYLKKNFGGHLFYTVSEALAAKADVSRRVYMVITDIGFFDTTLNFIESSAAEVNLENLLLICANEECAGSFRKLNLDVFVYKELDIGTSGVASQFGSASFMQKTQVRLSLILKALVLGYNILFSDADIALFRNPFDDIMEECDQCDGIFQIEFADHYCGGFYFLRSKPGTMRFLEYTITETRDNPNINDQDAIHNAKTMILDFDHKGLDMVKYSNGERYFERERRMTPEDNPCFDCIMVHNNYMVTNEAKTYRFKEMLWWTLDKDGYYSNPSNRFIIYSNPINFGEGQNIVIETKALEKALYIAYILNRILILPYFHCDNCKFEACQAPSGRCTLNTHFKIFKFDEQFARMYRERSFLKNPKVPEGIKESVSKPLLVEDSTVAELKSTYPEHFDNVENVLLQRQIRSLNETTFLNWLAPYLEIYAVLEFHSMYFDIEWGSRYMEFKEKIDLGLVKSDYRQYLD